MAISGSIRVTRLAGQPRRNGRDQPEAHRDHGLGIGANMWRVPLSDKEKAFVTVS